MTSQIIFTQFTLRKIKELCYMPIPEVPLGLAHHEYKSSSLLCFPNTHSSSILVLFKDTWGQFSSHLHNRLCDPVCAVKGALETISYSLLWLQPRVSPTGMRRDILRRKLHSGIKCDSWPRRQFLFLPSHSGPFLYSKTKANNGYLLPLEVTSRSKV